MLYCYNVIAKADVIGKLFSSSSEKTKACLSLELLLGVETEIIWRNCFERNETLVKKSVQVRERFASSKKLISEMGTHY